MKNIIGLGAIITILIIGYGNTKTVSKGVKIQFVRLGQHNAIGARNAGGIQGSVRGVIPEKKEPYTAVILPNQKTVADKIKSIFTEEPEKAVAVFRAESGLRANAKGWNCWYYNDDGTKYSAGCKTEDRDQAWSVDCGVAQLNFPGKECPTESLDADWNIQKAHEWKYLSNKKAGGTGWGPWVAHTNGNYKSFLAYEKKLENKNK